MDEISHDQTIVQIRTISGALLAGVGVEICTLSLWYKFVPSWLEEGVQI